MDALSLVSEYLKDLKECMDDGDSKIAKEAKLFDALEHKKIHGVKFKADVVVLDYVNEEEPSIVFGRDFLVTTKSQVDFGLGEIRINLTKFKKEEIPPTSTVPPQPIYHPLTPKQKEKKKEVLDIKYKELEESKPIIEVLENYAIYKKKLDEIIAYKDLGLGDLRPYQTNLTMADNTQVKAMGEVKNVRIQLGYQAYMVDLLILDILVDPELPLLLGRPFLRTCGAVIDMGRGNLYIDDVVICHTYFPKPQTQSYVKDFEMEGEDDWLGSFEVGRDEDGNVKYGLVAPSFIDIEDDIEMALAMEAYFNPFKNIRAMKYMGHTRKLMAMEIGMLVMLGLFIKDEVEHRLFEIYFGKLKVDDKQFDHKDYWTRVGKLVGRDAKTRFMDDEHFRGVAWIELTWIIAEHLYKHALGTKENSIIYVGHYVTRFASFLGYCVDDEIKKCSELIDCKYWTSRMLADKLDEENTCLKKEAGIPTQAIKGSSGQKQEHEGNFAYPTYEPPNVSPYPYPYIPYPYPHTHYPNPCNQSNQGGSYGLDDEDYFTSAMPYFGGSSWGYAVGGSSKDAGINDDDMDERHCRPAESSTGLPPDASLCRPAEPRWFLSQKESGVGKGVREKQVSLSDKSVEGNKYVNVVNEDTLVVVASAVKEGVTPPVVDMMMEKEEISPLEDTTVLESCPTLTRPVKTMAGNASGKSTYANINGKPSGKKVNVLTLFIHRGNGIYVVVLVDSIRAISERFANITYGFFLEKKVAYPVVANYVRNTWGKYGLLRSMFSSSTRLFSFQFSFIDGLDAMLENGPCFIRNNLLILKKWHPNENLLKEDGRSSYARVMIELRAVVELENNIVIAMLKITREGHYTCNVHVEYEWKPSRCSSCKVFGHIHKECPKNTGAGEKKTVKKPSQTSQGVPVGFKPQKEYRSVTKNPNASSSGNKKKGKLRILDNEENPLVPTGIVESDNEVKVVFDETANLRISTSDKDESDKGYGTNSLLEQWRDHHL
nr:hypothetical protein [Tanacetum cinerariifolium]